MMKRYIPFVVALAMGSAALAQTCKGTRYANDVFTHITATDSIIYGSNSTYSGATQSLTLDFYEPKADTAKARPLIIWVHGGSFVSGSSTDDDVDSLSHRFARKGYVCASINYRIGVSVPDSVDMIPAVIRAVQDLKAAVRFFYKDRATNNTYKIDTNNIFIGGSSAGAITVLHYAYLKSSCELSVASPTTDLTTMGGLDGTSGNPCYSSTIKGVISLCGALGRYGWLEKGGVPLCSMHGTADPTVPYNRAVVKPLNISIMWVDGDRLINKQAIAVGVQNNFYTWINAVHVPFAGQSPAQMAYMDTTVNFVRDYLIGRMGIICTNSQPADSPYGPAYLYGYTPCVNTDAPSCSYNTSGIRNLSNNQFENIYPNPSSSNIQVVFSGNNSTHLIALSDITGRIVKSDLTSESNYTLERGTLASGIYFLRVTNTQGQSSVRKIIFN